MSAVYMVVHAGYVTSVVGAYSGYQAASKKAIEIAEKHCLSTYLKEPKEQKKNDGSIEWIFSQAPLVFVSFRQIESPTHLQIVVVEPKDDPEDMDLPGGWDLNNKPILVRDLCDDPYSVKDFHSLTAKQQIALVTARIRKRPNFILNIPGWGTFNRDAALVELNPVSHIGEMIIESDLDILDKLVAGYM